jgi:hypothetical protein
MKRLMTLAVVAAAVASLPVLATGQMASAASAPAAECSPSISMGKPTQGPDGFVRYHIDYVTCEVPLLITVKHRPKDQEQKNLWYNYSFFTAEANSQGQFTTGGYCMPGGERYSRISIATLRTTDKKAVIAKTPLVFYRTKPVAVCGT